MTHLFYLLFFMVGTSYALPPSQHHLGLFWQVDKSGTRPSYLFGTIHSDDPRVTQLPPQIQQRLAQANSVALELLMDIPTIQAASNAKFFSGDDTLSALVADSDYGKIVTALQHHHLAESLVQKLKPWAVFVLLQTPPPKTGKYLDLLLYQQTMQLEIPPYGLEKVQEQVQLMDNLPLAEQLILLTDILSYVDELPLFFEKLHELYLQKDLTTLLTFSQNYLLTHSSHPSVTQAFLKRLLTDRNQLMLTRMLPRLQEGNAFIAVGALHLPGTDGLLELLVKRGYRVTALD